MTITYATPVLSLLKAQRVWGRAGAENCVLYARVSVFMGEVVVPDWGTEEVLAFHAGKVWKFAKRRELTTPCWAKRMGAKKRGENFMMVEKMTSERRGVNERGGWERMGSGDGRGGGFRWEKHGEGDPKPGHLLQREQLWTLSSWEEGHSRKLCILYTEAQILSRCLHPAQVCNNKAN